MPTTPGRNLTVQDVFSAIRTLDAASGGDSGHFRWRLRQWMRHEQELADQQRLELPDHAGACNCAPCDAAYGPRRQRIAAEIGRD